MIVPTRYALVQGHHDRVFYEDGVRVLVNPTDEQLRRYRADAVTILQLNEDGERFVRASQNFPMNLAGYHENYIVHDVPPLINVTAQSSVANAGPDPRQEYQDQNIYAEDYVDAAQTSSRVSGPSNVPPGEQEKEPVLPLRSDAQSGTPSAPSRESLDKPPAPSARTDGDGNSVDKTDTKPTVPPKGAPKNDKE